MPKPTPTPAACFSFFTSCPQAVDVMFPIEDLAVDVKSPIEDLAVDDVVSKSSTSSSSTSFPQLLDANKLAELSTAALTPGPMPGAYATMNRELKDTHRKRLRTKTDAPEIMRPEDTEKTDMPKTKKPDKPEPKKTDKPEPKKNDKPK